MCVFMYVCTGIWLSESKTFVSHVLGTRSAAPSVNISISSLNLSPLTNTIFSRNSWPLLLFGLCVRL